MVASGTTKGFRSAVGVLLQRVVHGGQRHGVQHPAPAGPGTGPSPPLVAPAVSVTPRRSAASTTGTRYGGPAGAALVGRARGGPAPERSCRQIVPCRPPTEGARSTYQSARAAPPCRCESTPCTPDASVRYASLARRREARPRRAGRCARARSERVAPHACGESVLPRRNRSAATRLSGADVRSSERAEKHGTRGRRPSSRGRRSDGRSRCWAARTGSRARRSRRGPGRSRGRRHGLQDAVQVEDQQGAAVGDIELVLVPDHAGQSGADGGEVLPSERG